MTDRVLAFGWMVAGLAFMTFLFLFGYAGALAFPAWGLLALPLAILTARRLSARGRPLDAFCRSLAVSSFIILFPASFIVLYGPLLLPQSLVDSLVFPIAAAFWILFVGQISYVLSVTPWLLRNVLRAK